MFVRRELFLRRAPHRNQPDAAARRRNNSSASIGCACRNNNYCVFFISEFPMHIYTFFLQQSGFNDNISSATKIQIKIRMDKEKIK